MCLIVNKKITTAFRKSHKPSDTFTAYKVVLQYNDFHGSKVLRSYYQGYIYTPGVHVSENAILNRKKRPFKKLKNRDLIYDGFHVYMTLKKARCHTYIGNAVIIKVKCKVSNVIALSINNEAVLTSIEIKQKDL